MRYPTVVVAFALVVPILSVATGTHAAPALDLSRAAVKFGRVPQNVGSQVQPVFVTSTGTDPLVVQSLAVGGADAGDFTTGGTCVPGLSLTPGGRCRIDLVMKVSARLPSDRLATLSVLTNAGAATVTLIGTVDASPSYAQPIVSAPEYIDFGEQAVGTSAGVRTLAITNPDSLTFTVSSLQLASGSGIL